MPFTVLTNRDKQLTRITVIGKPSFQESIERYKNFYKDNPPVNVLWDLRKASLAGISSKQIYEAINSIIPYVKKRVGGKTAFVVLKGLEYGMSRMVQTLTEIKNIPFRVEIFKTIDEAIKWINEEK